MDEGAEEECFYTPTCAPPSAPQSDAEECDIGPLLADLEAEMAAISALDVSI